MAAAKLEWETARLAAILALNTTMRGCELKGLRWRDVDLMERTIMIRRSKTVAGERVIPLNADALSVILSLREKAQKLFGDIVESDWYVFPHAEGYSKPDPKQPMSGWRSAWRSMTRAVYCSACGKLQQPAKVCANTNCSTDISKIRSPLHGLRFHDLRHHAITELAESQASERTIMAIAGHISTKMLDHYSHTLVARPPLDHACRVGKVQYRRSETGARLLSHDVIEKLRIDGLKAFPRPYDPIAPPTEQLAAPHGASGNALAAQRDKVEQKRVEIGEMHVSRELRQLKEQEQHERAERRAVAAAEWQRQAEQRGQAEHQRQQLYLEEARQAEARECRRQWEAGWLDFALKLLPCDVPHSFELNVHQAVAELLPRLDGYQPEQLMKPLIQAAVDKVLQPWHRKKEIEKIIDECRKQLPIEVRSSLGSPTEWEARAMQAAATAIAPLGNDAPLAEVRAAAALATSKICAE